MVRRTKAEAEATRESLLDAAEQVFLKRGVARATLEEVARHAGVTRGAIYWHFSNKNDLFEAMLDRVHLPFDTLVTEFGARVSGDPIETIREIGIFGLRALAADERRQRVYTILFHRCELLESNNPALQRQTEIKNDAKGHMRRLLERAAREGRLRPGVEPAHAVEVIHAFFVGVFNDWLADPFQYDLLESAAPMMDIVLNGVSQPGDD